MTLDQERGVFESVSWEGYCKTSSGGGFGIISVNMNTGGMSGDMVQEMSEEDRGRDIRF